MEGLPGGINSYDPFNKDYRLTLTYRTTQSADVNDKRSALKRFFDSSANCTVTRHYAEILVTRTGNLGTGEFIDSEPVILRKTDDSSPCEFAFPQGSTTPEDPQ